MYTYLKLPGVFAVFGEISNRATWGVEIEDGELMLWIGRLHVIFTGPERLRRESDCRN